MNGIQISTDKALLDLDTVHAFLRRTDWAKHRTREVVAESFATSLCFGAYSGRRQVGFARVVTDYCTFAYLCDVFVDEEFRGLGISRALMDAVMAHPKLQKLRRFVLATSTAHGLYRKFGFKEVPPDKFLEIKKDNV